jgi:hypothetical protein
MLMIKSRERDTQVQLRQRALESEAPAHRQAQRLEPVNSDSREPTVVPGGIVMVTLTWPAGPWTIQNRQAL